MCASPASPRQAQPIWIGGGLASRQTKHAPASAISIGRGRAKAKKQTNGPSHVPRGLVRLPRGPGTSIHRRYVCTVVLSRRWRSPSRACATGDLITSLPGWNATVDGPLPKMYSGTLMRGDTVTSARWSPRGRAGYIPVGNASGTPGFIHYWFILSQSDPQKVPPPPPPSPGPSAGSTGDMP